MYHVCVICNNDSPKTIFIMGGGEGSAAREALKHRSMERVVMCDIDQVMLLIIINYNYNFYFLY